MNMELQTIKNRVVRAYGTRCYCCEEFHEERLILECFNPKNWHKAQQHGDNIYQVLLSHVQKTHREWPKGFRVVCQECVFTDIANPICIKHQHSKYRDSVIYRNRFLRKLADRDTATAKLYEHYIRHFQNYLGFYQKTALSATYQDILDWRDDLEETGGEMGYPTGYQGKYKPNSHETIENKTCAVASYYKHVEMEMSRKEEKFNNPIKGLGKRHTINHYNRAKTIELDVYLSLIQQINRTNLTGSRNYALLEAYLWSGKRGREIRNLQWKDIVFKIEDNKEMVIFKFVRKGEIETSDIMPLEMWQAIEPYLKKRWGDDYRKNIPAETFIFSPLPRKGQIKNKSVSPQYIWQLLRVLAHKAKIDKLEGSTHLMRHLCARLMYLGGFSIEDIRARLNHSSIATTAIYLSKMTNPNTNYSKAIKQARENLKEGKSKEK